MYLIVGLGNPDEKYKNTFHNLGFMAIDKVAEKLGVTFKKCECKGITAETFVNGQKVVLLKPLTYMNLSGESVSEMVNKYKIPLDNIIVIYDDFDLPRANIRIRSEGSAGTHNGMKNIIALLKEQKFVRIRIGMGSPNSPIPIVDYVLSGIPKSDKALFDETFNKVAMAVEKFILGEKLENIMQEFNSRK